MPKVVSFIGGILLLGFTVNTAQAAFNALYVFSDSISTTTNNPATGPYYYGQRYSNGRVWVEVLAQRQGLPYDPNKNWSYFGDTSTDLVAHVSSFQPPGDASNGLFIIWVNCADLYYPAYYSGSNTNAWTNAINQSQINHYKAVTNLYFAKGVRTLILPNVVDLSTIPLFNASSSAKVIHQMCANYNVAFSGTMNRIRAACPNLTLYSPDFFSLLTNILAYPTNYLVTNALYGGLSVDALDDPALNNKTTNGPGANYIFWDEKDPSAKVHMWMANLAQQLMSPAQISGITVFSGSNRLDLANVPIGQNGLVLDCTNLAAPAWKTNVNFTGTNLAQSVYVTNSGSPWYYRLRYLYSWTWP